MTANANMAAVLTLLNAALPSGVDAYDLDEVPKTRPTEYVDAVLGRRFGGENERRASSHLWLTGYRLTVRATSETSVMGVRTSLEACRAALEYQRLVVGGETSTPIQFETEDPPGSDSGWFSGVMAFTYTIRG